MKYCENTELGLYDIMKPNFNKPTKPNNGQPVQRSHTCRRTWKEIETFDPRKAKMPNADR